MLFALDTSGTVRGRVRVPIRTRDWEDVSAARCASGDCLYIADIGDNRRERQRIRIYRVPEPAPEDEETAPPEVFDATYADGPHNAEAMFVVGEDLFIIQRPHRRRLRTTVTGSRADISTHRSAGARGGSDAEAARDEVRRGESISRSSLVSNGRSRGRRQRSPTSAFHDGLMEAQAKSHLGEHTLLSSEGVRGTAR